MTEPETQEDAEMNEAINRALNGGIGGGQRHGLGQSGGPAWPGTEPAPNRDKQNTGGTDGPAARSTTASEPAQPGGKQDDPRKAPMTDSDRQRGAPAGPAARSSGGGPVCGARPRPDFGGSRSWVNGQSASPPDGQVESKSKKKDKDVGFGLQTKPRTEREIAEFRALWHNENFPVTQLMAKYKASRSTVQRWSRGFGLTDRTALKGMVPSAKAFVRTMEQAGTAVIEAQQIVDAQAQDGILYPRQDEEIAEGLAELKVLAKRAAKGSPADLAAFHRQALSLIGLFVAKSPIHTWDGGAAIADTLCRAIAMARKVEAAMPKEAIDPQMLRREAATQMMRELRSVLSPEKQEALAVLIKEGADLINKRREREAGGQVVS